MINNALKTTADIFAADNKQNYLAVMDNDVNQPNDLTAASFVLTQPQHGTVQAPYPTYQESGTNIITYTPAPGYVGPDSFTYALKNTAGTSNFSVVTLNVVDTRPVANNDTFTVAAGSGPTYLDFAANDSFANIAFPGVSIESSGANGIYPTSYPYISPIDYQPAPGFSGVETFTYQLIDSNDSSFRSNLATVTINVTGANQSGPIANPDSATTSKGQPVTLNLTSNDTNVGTSKANVVNYPSSGNVVYANSAQTSVIYTPNTGFVGTDTFTYRLKSATSTSNTATVTVTVNNTTTPPPAGSAVATADAVSTSKGQAVTFNPTSNDTNVGTSIVNIVSYPGSGNVAYSDNTSKSITYTPNATFTGTDTFTYNLKSSAGTSNTVTVTITVGGTTPPPTGTGAVANGDTMTTTKGKAVTLNLTSNDTNVGTSTVNIAGYPNNGNVAYSDSTKKSVTYTPDATFVGSDSFTYNLKSASGTSNTATVSVKVQ